MTRFLYNSKEINLKPSYKNRAEYLRARDMLLSGQRAIRFDHDITLNYDESKVNKALLTLKNKEIKHFINMDYFPPARPFSEAKSVIENSPLFAIIRKMPKGAVLHLHDLSMGNSQILLELTYMKNCCMYIGQNDLYGALYFFNPSDVPSGWKQVSTLREQMPDFDKMLLKLITLDSDNQSESYSSGLQPPSPIWKKFEQIFSRIVGLVTYLPAANYYYTRALEAFINDNVRHVEVRSEFIPFYDLDGNTFGPEQQLQMFDRILESHPEISMRFIYSCLRNKSKITVWQQMEKAIQLRANHPNLISGFDLIGDEDAGHSTLFFLNNFLNVNELTSKYGIDLPFFFHDGESNWASDTNLYDAVLLGSRRIGHGYNLFCFPILEPLLRETDTPLEVCPISNQMLGYIADIRNHPAGGYLNRGIPFTLNSDDPAVYGYSGVSCDFWEAFFAWDLDLRSLKKLALNSITYSSQSHKEKQHTMQTWLKSWEQFIADCISGRS